MTNAANIANAMQMLRSIILDRLKKGSAVDDPAHLQAAIYLNDESPYASFMREHDPTVAEYVLLMLSLAPHVQPAMLSDIIAEHLPSGGDFPAFGGVKGANHRGLLPTGETAQFLVAGDDLDGRLRVQRMFTSDHWFAQKHILSLEPVTHGEPAMSGRLTLDPEVVEILTTGTVARPRFGLDFPAEYITTEMVWDDLVLYPGTRRQIQEIQAWIAHNDTLVNAWGMKRRIKPGYRALFHGPPGTGKTLTATILGAHTGKDVFRVDLSLVVSKYIGEAEKSLSRLFDTAEHKNWILFFDEADALFGKRTDIRDAHDKYANQEVAYLLQRVEAYNGLIILASNQRTHIDDAFTRRFQAVIHFPPPRPEERYEIWRKTIPERLHIADDIDWRQIAARYELTGAGILNVVHFCALEALAANSHRLELKHLEAGIMREFVKEGKVV